MKILNVLLLVFQLSLISSSWAQTCNPNAPASAPDSRFVVNASGTVFDTATNLTWKRCSEGQVWNGTTCAGAAGSYAWQQALQLAEAASFAGLADWRLPDLKELSSLVEQRCTYPAINVTIFPNTLSWYYWSGSPYAEYFDNAWDVNFDEGVVYYNNKSGGYSHGVRLVRGGQ